MGAVSLAHNASNGNYGAAAIDTVGVVIDSAATVVPFVPGGASALVKGGRVANDVPSTLARVVPGDVNPTATIQNVDSPGAPPIPSSFELNEGPQLGASLAPEVEFTASARDIVSAVSDGVEKVKELTLKE